MMETIRLIDIKEEILSDNRGLADRLRARLAREGVFLLNVMGSPGAGKTSLVLRTLEELGERRPAAVLEADVDSMVDAEAVAERGVPAVQIRTGGFCHVDANMVERALESLPLDALDLVILENVGNLVCPAESDTGAHRNVAILSVPEGDDKPLKYPLMFATCDALVVNKTDYLALADFDLNRMTEQARALNPELPIFPVSCRTAEGLEGWIGWLEQAMDAYRSPEPKQKETGKW